MASPTLRNAVIMRYVLLAERATLIKHEFLLRAAAERLHSHLTLWD